MLLSQFGESVVYFPNGGGRRPILAIIEPLRVYNSCRSGIASQEINIGKDEIEFVLKVGQTLPKRFSFMTLVSQDSGVCQLAVI